MGTNSDLYLIGIAVLIFLIIVFLYLRKISNSGKLKVKIEEVPESFKEDKSLEIEGQQAFEFNEEEIKSYEEDQELAILNLISVDRSMFDNDQVYGFLTNYGAILKNNYFSYQDINGNEIFRVANALNPGTFENDTKTFAIVAASNLSLTNDPVDAVKQMLTHDPDYSKITEKRISKFLYNDEMPDPDLIIRTSGEQRISNFLLWQSAYSEFLFLEELWPDFSRQSLHKAIREYQNRTRRFGDL